MAFELSWLVEGRVVFARVYGTLTDADDAVYDQSIQEYLDRSGGLPVHVVTDYSGLERIQTAIRPGYNAHQPAPLTKHPALGIRVGVGNADNPLLRYMEPLCSHALKPCSTVFNALEGALAHLCQVDRTLPAYFPHSGGDASLARPA